MCHSHHRSAHMRIDIGRCASSAGRASQHRAQELGERTTACSVKCKGCNKPQVQCGFKSGQVETASVLLLQLPLPSLCSRLPLHSPWQIHSCLKANTAPAWASSAVPPAITGSSTPNPLHSSAAHGLISLKVECLFPLLATISTEKCTPFPIQLKHCASPFETFSVDCHWQECEDYAAF